MVNNNPSVHIISNTSPIYLQGKEVASIVKEYGLIDVLVEILENSKLQDKAHQSALALLGHTCSHCFEMVCMSTFNTYYVFNEFENELNFNVNSATNLLNKI